MNGETADGGLTYHERLERLERQQEKDRARIDDLEAASLEHGAMMRAICDGRIAKRNAPHVLSQILLDALGLLVVAALLGLVALNYLVSRPVPWPFKVYVPPPHSTQLPVEKEIAP